MSRQTMTRKAALVASTAASLALLSPLHADTFTWNIDGAGNWNDTTKWSPNTGSPNGVGDEAQFEFNITGNRTITQNVPNLTLGTITFHDLVTNSHTFTISVNNSIRMEVASGSALIRSFNSPSNSAFNTVLAPLVLASNLILRSDANALRVAGISETGGAKSVTKTGAGTVDVGGVWEHTGATDVLDGTLSLGEPANRISASSALSVTNSRLQMGSVRRTNPDRLPDTASITLAAGNLVHTGDGNTGNSAQNAREVVGALTLDLGFNRIQASVVSHK